MAGTKMTVHAVMLLALCAVALAARSSAADCSKLVCEDTNWGYLKHQSEDDGKGGCHCVPFFKKGSSCFNQQCPRQHLAVVEGNECKCINPCAGLSCKLPQVLVPDYTRRSKDYCHCQTPTDGAHYPLPTTSHTGTTYITHMARDHLPTECEGTCDTKLGFLKYWPEKVDGECNCVPHFPKSSPCNGRTCGDSSFLLAIERGDECMCTDPCQGKVCDPPFSPVIDYMRETATLCKCAKIEPKKKEDL